MKRGLVILNWYIGEGMETNITGEKVKKNAMHAVKNDIQVYY